jgi:hypothetical protein
MIGDGGLLGEPLPFLSHFDEQRFLLWVRRFARLFEASRRESLIRF